MSASEAAEMIGRMGFDREMAQNLIEILQMQFQQARAAQNVHVVQANNWIYNLSGLGSSDDPPCPSLADRHAKLANGLEAAMGKFEERYGYRPGCPSLPAA